MILWIFKAQEDDEEEVPTIQGRVSWRLLWRVFKTLMRPTCLGCSGICERMSETPGECQCFVDDRCLQNQRG
jgi:hypothetical protein